MSRFKFIGVGFSPQVANRWIPKNKYEKVGQIKITPPTGLRWKTHEYSYIRFGSRSSGVCAGHPPVHPARAGPDD